MILHVYILSLRKEVRIEITRRSEDFYRANNREKIECTKSAIELHKNSFFRLI